MSYDVNNGNQQVSIFPYQDLSSVYGNMLFYGLFDPGVYFSSLSVRNNGSTFDVVIGAGTTMMFKRQTPQNDYILGKIVLTSEATITVVKEECWFLNASLSNSSRIYIVADWDYDLLEQNNKYVDFSLHTDTDISTIKADNGTTSHKLIIGSLLNQLYFQGDDYTKNVANYHISYDEQTNRNLIKKLANRNNQFLLDFSSTGRGIKLAAGTSMISDTLISLPASGSYLLPPVAVTSYVSNRVNNTVTAITEGNQGNFYQIDFLRLVKDEQTGATGIRWESFVKTKSTVIDFSLSSAITQNQLIEELKNTEFDLTDEGLTLLISVRPRAGVPLVDGDNNLIWPEHCLVMENVPSLSNTGSPSLYSRMRLPVYKESDL